MKNNLIYIILIFFLSNCGNLETAEIHGELYFISKTKNPDSLIYKSFHDNGVQNSLRSIKNGLEHGPYKKFDKAGSLEIEANYFNGERNGELIAYNSEGDTTIINYYLKDSIFYSKSISTGIEQITPIINLQKDSIFLGDTLIFQYKVPIYEEISVGKNLYLFFRLESEKMEGTLFYPNDSLHITSKEFKQIGIVIDKAGEQMIYGFLGNRSEKESINYEEYRKYITVYPR